MIVKNKKTKIKCEEEIMQITREDISSIDKNHMPIPWHSFGEKNDSTPIKEASLSEKSTIIGRIGFMLLSCGKVKQGLVIPSHVSMSNVYFHLIAEPFISPALRDIAHVPDHKGYSPHCQ